MALGLADGDGNAGNVASASSPDGTTHFTGTVRFVEGLSFATHLLVTIGLSEATEEVALIRTDAAGVTVTLTPGFAIPPLGEVRLENVPGQSIPLTTGELAENLHAG